MKLFKKKVLIVGGKGFIGSHLTLKLDGDVVDLQDGVSFSDVPPHKVDTIVLLAVDMNRTYEGFHNNASLFEKLDEWLEAFPKTHVIYTSSAAVYPDARCRHRETDLPEPENWYGKAKLLGEQHVRQYRNHTILRLSNVFGLGGSGVINLFEEGTRTIFGTGKEVRDYISVHTVVDVIVKAVYEAERWFGVTNVSSGHGQKTINVFRKFGKGKPEFVKARKGDVKCSILDNSRMDSLLWSQ